MVALNIFTQDPFSTLELTAAIERVPYQPQALGQLGIFDPFPIRTTQLMVEERQGQLVLIPFSQRGQRGVQRTTEQRKARSFVVPRLRHEDTIYAHELQNIRAFGTESELMQVEAEVARRYAGPTGLLRNLEYTWEYHRLAAIQGKLLDANGDELYDWFDEFQKSAPAEIAFNLTANTEDTIRPLCNALVRSMARAAQGAFIPNVTQVYALCGDNYWDKLVTHQDVKETYKNWEAARELRGAPSPTFGDVAAGATTNKFGAFGAMPFAEINWFNYRGSDDTTTIAIDPDEVKFFPVGAPGIFQVAYAPGESFQWANQLGQPYYAQIVPDRDRNEWVSVEISSYPLHICTRPEVLFKGRVGS